MHHFTYFPFKPFPSKEAVTDKGVPAHPDDFSQLLAYIKSKPVDMLVWGPVNNLTINLMQHLFTHIHFIPMEYLPKQESVQCTLFSSNTQRG